MPAGFPVTNVTVGNDVEVKNDSGNPVPVSAPSPLSVESGGATIATEATLGNLLVQLEQISENTALAVTELDGGSADSVFGTTIDGGDA